MYIGTQRVARNIWSSVGSLSGELLEGGGPWSRAFERLILGLIVLSVLSVGLEAAPALPPWVTPVLRAGELFTIVVFSLEYMLRLSAARHKVRFIFSFGGVVDLLSFAPFYLAGFDTRWLRMLRLLRLVRILKLQTHYLEKTVAARTRELAEKNVALEHAQARIKAELEVARALQQAILPASFPERAGYEAAARMIPATTLGGDFYDFIELPEQRIGLVMADVSGKGVPAAFFMAVARTNLRDCATRHVRPGDCLAHTNDVLCTQNPMDLFVTVFYCVLDPISGQLEYANAGHTPPYLRRAGGAIELLDGAGGLVLGVLPGAKFQSNVVQLQPGDRLVLYTDGVTEAFNLTDEAYGSERLLEEIRTHGHEDAAGLIERICRSVSTFAGTAPQSDDITITVLGWNRSGPGP